MANERDRFQIGEFAELVGLSIPQLRRYDRLRLLAPEGRTPSGYRVYGSQQTGAARVIALLRSMDMPLADVRRVLAGLDEAERQELFAEHRARLEARLDEVRSLLDAVDQLTTKGTDTMSTPTPTPARIHSQHPIPRSHQRCDEQTPIGLSRDRHLTGVVDMGGDQLMEPGDPFDTFRESPTRETTTIAVHDEHIMVSLSPIMTNKHFHQILTSRSSMSFRARRRPAAR